MAEFQFNGQNVEINVQEELEQFEWKNATWTSNKLIACSPFREDNRPSFYCFLEDDPRTAAKAGFFGDSGGSGEYEKGGFISLLSFLREETPEDTIEYLLDKYGSSNSSNFQFKKLKLNNKRTKKPTLPLSLIENLQPHDYLVNRGIPKGIQKALKIGYDKDKKAMAFPWFLPNGELANVKYRKTTSKRFFYASGGWSNSKLLFGIQIFHQKEYLKTAVITEAEIDSLSCITAGYPSLAAGGSKWSDEKRDLILRTNIRNLVIASDNDEDVLVIWEDGTKEEYKTHKECADDLNISVSLIQEMKDTNKSVKEIGNAKIYSNGAGQKLRKAITESLNGYVQILHVTFPADCKDCNDVLVKYGKERLKQMIEEAKVSKSRFNLNFKLE